MHQIIHADGINTVPVRDLVALLLEQLTRHGASGIAAQAHRRRDCLHAARVPIFCDSSRNCRRKILPTLVFGSSVLNSTSRGTL
jgi:hypothetical protein